MKKLLLSFSLLLMGFTSFAQAWVEQATAFTTASRGIEDVQIVDANTVWCTAYDGVTPTNAIQEFTRTSDGGSTWTPGLIDVGDTTLSITNITAVDALTAWVGVYDGTNGLGAVYQTTDGGVSWNQQTISEFTTSAESWLDAVHFFNANNGIAFGDPEGGEFEVYTTADGGNTWTRVPGTSLPDPAAGEYGYNGGYAVAGNTIWFTTNKGKIYKTTDMGVTWSKINGPTGFTDFGSAAINGRLHFSNDTTGLIIGTLNGSATTPTYKIWKTVNGTTWDTGTVYTGYRLLTYIPGTTTIVSTSQSATPGTGSAYSIDNGVTWTTIDTGTQRGSVAFLDGSTGWCGGFNVDDVLGGIFKFDGNLGNQQFDANTVKVYPNPASTVVTISAQQLDSYNVKVTDITGKVMLTREFSTVENTVDVSNFAAGVYFFEINSGSKSHTVKIMKN